MGVPKQLLDLDGKPLLQHVLDAASAAQLEQVILVLGAHQDTIVQGVLPASDVDVVINADHEVGQSTSLHAGLAATRAEIERAVILLGDQPFITTQAIERVAHSVHGPIVRASYGRHPSHPVALDRSVWELVAARGDQGARDLIASRPELVHLEEVGGEAPSDIDTPEDYLRATRRR